MQIVSRSAAKALGLKRYFTGKPCRHGHIAERLLHGYCVECQRNSYTANRATIIERVNNWAKHNRERRRQTQREWKARNRDDVLEASRIYRDNNRIIIRQRYKEYYRANTTRIADYHRQYRALFPEKRKAACDRWSKANRGKERAKASRRYTAQRKAMPRWLSPDAQLQITALYEQAVLQERLTGIPHHVDHIEPIQGKDRCGLHVPWNLQILTAKANQSKGNRRPVVTPCDSRRATRRGRSLGWEACAAG